MSLFACASVSNNLFSLRACFLTFVGLNEIFVSFIILLWKDEETKTKMRPTFEKTLDESKASMMLYASLCVHVSWRIRARWYVCQSEGKT